MFDGRVYPEGIIACVVVGDCCSFAFVIFPLRRVSIAKPSRIVSLR